MLDRIRIVLVEPRHPGNIGSAARAMKTMGINQLVLVNPARFPDPQADWRAAGAMDVLDKAIVVDDVASAVADCHVLVGTSTRSRHIPWPVAGILSNFPSGNIPGRGFTGCQNRYKKGGQK